MSLEMRAECERCKQPLTYGGKALICSYECTFCPSCGAEMAGRCPNCGGELVHRPRRALQATDGAGTVCQAG